MSEKGNGFWLFPLDNPDLYRFYTEQKNNNTLYYAIYIKKCARDFPADTKEILHIKENSVLLVDAYLIPVFFHSHLKGYVAVISESFWMSGEAKSLLKFTFVHNKPEGIINMGYVSIYQKKCMNALYREYHSPHDDMRGSVLRNLLVNLILLSPETDYEGQFKSGHLLNYALQFIYLIDIHAFNEKKKSFYADKINITEKMLDKSLGNIYHKTFKDMLANRIIIEAMRLLVFSNKPVTQIAHELGYDSSDFIKFFFRQKGMYPKTLRENYRKMINEIEKDC